MTTGKQKKRSVGCLIVNKPQFPLTSKGTVNIVFSNMHGDKFYTILQQAPQHNTTQHNTMDNTSAMQKARDGYINTGREWNGSARHGLLLAIS